MYFLRYSVIICLFFVTLHYSSGYKWVHVKPGNQIPADALILNDDPDIVYVGRARHYDEVLPAEVFNSTYAVIYTCSEIIIKTQFEVLVDTESCSWRAFKEIADVNEQVVRVGNQWNGEPNYLGFAHLKDEPNFRIASILLTSNKMLEYEITDITNQGGLFCKDNSEWVDSLASKIPKTAVSGGKSNNDNDIYVARLKKNCDIVPGQVVPDLGIATAKYQGIDIESAYAQVLLENKDNYSWVYAFNGEIPDYAVYAGKSESNELMYVARMNNTLGYVVHSEALQNEMFYEILVKEAK